MAEPVKNLIADDENIFLNSTADLSRREGYHCDTAADGETAGKRIAKGERGQALETFHPPLDRKAGGRNFPDHPAEVGKSLEDRR